MRTATPIADLHERVYADALLLAASAADPECVADGLTTEAELAKDREDIRAALLDRYPAVEGPCIADLMDEAITEAWGFVPMDCAPAPGFRL